LSHQARKRFGQNFLHDQALIERIIAHINPSSDDHVVEVGPGLGAITFPLLDRLQRLNVIEIDRDLVARLDVPPESFNPPPKVQSAVVRLVPRADAPDAQTIVRLSDATRLAFANKRKTLRNNLKSILSVEQLQNADLDPQARAETLSLDQFLLLAKMLP